jgi:NADPH2:quinone reductase
MRAIQIDRYGGAEVLEMREIDVPVPGHGEVLVQLAYAGINFMDVYTRCGKYAKSAHYNAPLPQTLGIEGAGRIVALGQEVEGWRMGDRVAYCLARGSYAEYAAVPASQIVAVPDTLGLDIAAAAMFQGVTAHYLAHDVGRLGPGSSCLIHAGAGGIGQILIQLAKRLGSFVIATASTEEKVDIARRRGADVVTDYNNAVLLDSVSAATADMGVDVVFDSVGLATFSTSMRVLKKCGLLVLYGSNSGPVEAIDPMQLADHGSLFFTRPRLVDYVSNAVSMQRRAGDIFAALIDGTLAIDIAEVYNLDTVGNAHRALEERRSLGKCVICLDANV